MKTQKDNKMQRIMIYGFFIVEMVFANGLAKGYSDRADWWTKNFCVGEGELEEHYLYDKCIIDGEEYKAEFVKTNRPWTNETGSGFMKEWRLIKQ